MNTFLATVALDVYQNFGKGISNAIFIFPNRRSGQAFKEALSHAITEPIWTPLIQSMSDWILSIDPRASASDLQKQLVLYDAVRKYWPQVGRFRDFIRWSDVLLEDFDELDRNLLEAEQVYAFFAAAEEIDLQFSLLNEDDIINLKKFWGSFAENPSRMQLEWLSLWRSMPQIYQEFHQGLELFNCSTEGMAYRTAVELISNSNEDSRPLQMHHIFVGFNALSIAEEKLLSYFQEHQHGIYYWDIPPYLSQDHHPAGKLIRQYAKKFPAPVSFQLLNSQNPNRFSTATTADFNPVEVYRFDTAIAQAKAVPELIKNQKGLTGIVLSDESIAQEVYYALGKGMARVNSSIGLPLIQSQIAVMLMALFERSNLGAMNALVYWSEALAQKGIAFREEAFEIAEEDKQLCVDLLVTRYAISRYRESLADQENQVARFERSCCQKLDSLLSIGMADLRLLTPSMLFSEWYPIVNKWLAVVKLPFEGIENAEIHITGILETRLLDYDNLIILSMNEGHWPSKQQPQSFIPYHVRKKYDLPVKESQDRIFAYHFFRSLQRSKTVHICHVAEGMAQGVGTGERSRFMHQLEYDLGWAFKHHQVRFPIDHQRPGPILISKTPEIIEVILNKYGRSKEGRALSPSAINTLVDCSLKFAYQYLLSIRDSSESSDPAEPRLFGTLLHAVLESIYDPLKGKTVDSGFCSSMVQNGELLKQKIELVFRKHLTHELESKDRLLIAVVKEYIELILLSDAAYAPFSPVHLEQYLESVYELEIGEQLYAIRIGGIVDRIDQKSGQIRIVDYKTGQPNMKFKDWTDLIDSDLSSRPKEVFQTLLYCWLYHQHYSEQTKIQPAIYSVRSLKKGLLQYEIYFDKLGLTEYEDYQAGIDSTLKQVLRDLFDRSIPFEQTSNKKNCEWCEFKELCQV